MGGGILNRQEKTSLWSTTLNKAAIKTKKKITSNEIELSAQLEITYM